MNLIQANNIYKLLIFNFTSPCSSNFKKLAYTSLISHQPKNMKPSLRAPVLRSVTSLKLNHWLLERKNVHISGPPGRRRAGGWASAMLRVLKAQFKTLSLSVEQNFRRSQQPERAPTPLPSSQTSARPRRLRVVRNVRSEEALHGE